MSKDFLKLFSDAIEMPADQVAPDAEIRQLEKWDSVAALSVLAMVEEQYGVELSGDDFANVTTVADLQKLVDGRAKR
jgi:acyl carrier protein